MKPTHFRILPVVSICWLAPVVMLISCTTPEEHQKLASTAPSLPDSRDAVSMYVDSGQYSLDIAKVVQEVAIYIKARASSREKQAIVLDIDETALSNVTALRLNDWNFVRSGQCDVVDGPCNIFEWISMGMCEPIAPTVELVKQAQSLGISIIFITARSERYRLATENNLRRVGYVWNMLLMRNEQLGKSVADYKVPIRQRLVETEGYLIIANIGDQESDLSGGFAEKTFKLPNPFYRSR